MNFKEKLIEGANLLDEHKARDIVVLDLKNMSSISDYFLICSGNNSRQVSSLADYAEDFFAKNGYDLHHKEGHQAGDWIILDYLDFMIHIFTEEKREHYKLDKLWDSAKKIYE